jgi:hypothetical protein
LGHHPKGSLFKFFAEKLFYFVHLSKLYLSVGIVQCSSILRTTKITLHTDVSNSQRGGQLSKSVLCAPCSSILDTAWEARISVLPGHRLWDSPVDSSVSFPWHPTLADAKTAAAEGCHFCSLICRYSIQPESLDLERPVKVRFKHSDNDYGRWDFAVITPWNDFNVLQLCVRGARSSLWEGIGDVPSYGAYDDDKAVPEELADMLRNWLNTCAGEHNGCKVAEQVNLPSRLLEISDSGIGVPKIRLVAASPEHRGRYITLSHCWGQNPELNGLTRTLEENVKDYYNDVPYDVLTQTFKDAVQVTRALGVQHLWIDSLCIIQKDSKDWEQESIKMADIYAYSLVTIAAAGSQSDGLFLHRKKAEMTPVIWPTPEPGNLLAFHPFLLRNFFDYESIPQPIYGRAWCMQELTLSRRVLHFLPGQVVWNCTTSTRHEFDEHTAGTDKSACLVQEFAIADLMVDGKLKPLPPTATFFDTSESLPDADRGHRHLRSSAKLLKSAEGRISVCFGHPQASGEFLGRLRQSFTVSKDAYMARTQKVIIGRPRPRTLHDEWLSLVENYSTKGITMTGDRLPAIWSFAARMRATTDDEYCCGLWRSDITRGLTFMLYNSPKAKRSDTKPVSPSWSWAFREGKLRYYGDGRLHPTKTADPLARPSLMNFEDEGAMSMGRSTRAVLTLKCLAAPVTGVPDEEKPGQLLRCGALEISLDNVEFFQTLAGAEILCLHMMDYCCLLVRPANVRRQEFERVGLGYVRHQRGKGFKEVKDDYLDLPWRETKIRLI